MAREIIVGKDGKAEPVVYIDKATQTEQRVQRARICGGGQRVRIGAVAAEFEIYVCFLMVWRILQE